MLPMLPGLGAIALAVAAGSLVSVNASVSDMRCATDLDRWARALLDDLPAYANRQLVRSGAETRILLAGLPEIDFPANLSTTNGERSGNGVLSESPDWQDNPPEEVARVFFSTAERPRRGDFQRSERAYRLWLTRRHGGTWLPLSLEIAETSSLEPTDVTEGAIWQAIHQWQVAGCPSVILPFQTAP